MDGVYIDFAHLVQAEMILASAGGGVCFYLFKRQFFPARCLGCRVKASGTSGARVIQAPFREREQG